MSRRKKIWRSKIDLLQTFGKLRGKSQKAEMFFGNQNAHGDVDDS